MRSLLVLGLLTLASTSECYPGRRVAEGDWNGDHSSSYAHWVQWNYDFNLGRPQGPLQHEKEEGFGRSMIPTPPELGDVSQWSRKSRAGADHKANQNPEQSPNAHIRKGDTIQKYMFDRVKNRTLFDYYTGEFGYWQETFLEHDHQRHHDVNQDIPKAEAETKAEEVDWLITTNSSLLWYRHAMSHLITEDVFQIENLKHKHPGGDSSHVGGERSRLHDQHHEAMIKRRALLKKYLNKHLLFPIDAEAKEKQGDVRLLGDSHPWCTTTDLWRAASPHPAQNSKRIDHGAPPGWCFIPWDPAVPEALRRAYPRVYKGEQAPSKEANRKTAGAHATPEDLAVPQQASHAITNAGLEDSEGIEFIPKGMQTLTLSQVLKKAIPDPKAKKRDPNLRAENWAEEPLQSLPAVHLVYESITRDMFVPKDRYEEVFRAVVEDVLEGWATPFGRSINEAEGEDGHDESEGTAAQEYEATENRQLQEAIDVWRHEQELKRRTKKSVGNVTRRGGYRQHFYRITQVAQLHVQFIDDIENSAEAWLQPGYRDTEAESREEPESYNADGEAENPGRDEDSDDDEITDEEAKPPRPDPTDNYDLSPWNPYQNTIVANKARPVTFVKMQQLVAHEVFHHIQHIVSDAKGVEEGHTDETKRMRRSNKLYTFFVEGSAEAAVELVFAREGPMPRAKHLASLLLAFNPRFTGTSLETVEGALAVADLLVEMDDFKQQISWRTVVRIAQQWHEREITENYAQMQLRREALVTHTSWPNSKFMSDHGKHIAVPYSLGKMQMLIALGRWAPLDYGSFPFPLYHESVDLDHTAPPRATVAEEDDDEDHPFGAAVVTDATTRTTVYSARKARRRPSVCVLPKLMDLPSHLMPGGHEDPASQRELSRFRFHQDKWTRTHHDKVLGPGAHDIKKKEEASVIWRDGVQYLLIPAPADAGPNARGRFVKLVDGDVSHSMALVDANVTLAQDGEDAPPPPVPECALLFSSPDSRAAKESKKAKKDWVRKHREEYNSYFSLHDSWGLHPLPEQWTMLEVYTEHLYSRGDVGENVWGNDWWRKPGDSGSFGPIH